MAAKKTRFKKILSTNEFIGGKPQNVEDETGSIPALVWKDDHKNTYRAMIVNLDFCNAEEFYRTKVLVDIKPNGLDIWNYKATYDLVNDKNNFRNKKTGKLVLTENAFITKTIKLGAKLKTEKVLSENVVTGGGYFTENLFTKSHSLYDLLLTEIAEKENAS